MRRNSVVYQHGALTEWYRNGPLGLEQGFTVQHRLAGKSGQLVIALRARGSLVAHQAGSEVLFTDSHGTPVLRYGGLAASDARGRTLPSWLALERGRILLRVDTANARYPLRVDPLVQQGSPLTPSDESGYGLFGTSVGLSSDGKTALIGGPADNGGVGAAWVFTRSGSTWTQLGAKITGGSSGFGSSVALSSDGNTALIGGAGGAWVFTRSVSSWIRQGAELTGSTESASESTAVAFSSEGNTALVTAAGTGDGWVFTRSGETWTQQGSLAGSFYADPSCECGSSAALSADGNTALIGGPNDDGTAGAAWVFTRSGSTWTQQGPKLTTGELSYFGASVALSSDGNTALIGGPQADETWVFTRSSEVWTQQGPPLSDRTGFNFGSSVALSADGNTALISDPGVDSSSVFTRSGETWTQQGATLTAGGSGVALSAAATTALVGGTSGNGDVGAVRAFVSTPIWVSGLSPSLGPPGGGTEVTISGGGFTNVTAVMFGSTPASSFTVDSPTQITATAPAASLGPEDVTVTTAQGTSPASPLNAFSYATAPGAATGLSAVAGFEQETVSFAAAEANGTPVTDYTVTASPGGAQASGSVSPITVTGLNDDTSYTFTATATNAAGTGPVSAASSPVTTAVGQTTTSVLSSVNPSVYGQEATFTATVVNTPSPNPVTPAGTVQFTIDGSNASNPVELNASGEAAFTPATPLDVGHHVVSAVYSGDPQLATSTSPDYSQTVEPTPTRGTITPDAITSLFGEPMSFTATVTSTQAGAGTPKGTVQFEVTGEKPVPVTLSSAGTAVFEPPYYLNVGDTVTVKYEGDPAHLASTFELKPTIEPASTETSLSAASNPANSGTALAFTAKVTNKSTSITPSGIVEFFIDGERVLTLPLENGEVGIEGEGGALTPGDHVVRAVYREGISPTPDFSGSEASLTEHITSPPAPPKPPPATPPPPPAFQASLTGFPLGTTVSGLVKHGLSDSVALNAPGTIVEDLYAENGTIPATATIAQHKPRKRHRAALLLAKGSASTATGGTVTVTLLPTVAGKKTLKKARHAVHAVLLTSVKDAKTGTITNLPPKTLTLKR